MRGVTEDAQPAQITSAVEYRAPKTFVRSSPVSPARLVCRVGGAPYIGQILRNGPCDILASRSASVFCRARVIRRIGRPRDHCGRHAILYHGWTDPRARHGGVAKLNADEGEAIPMTCSTVTTRLPLPDSQRGVARNRQIAVFCQERPARLPRSFGFDRCSRPALSGGLRRFQDLKHER